MVRGHEGILDGGGLPEGLRSLQSGAVPPEVDLLLREAVLTDPYRVDELAAWSADDYGHPPDAARTPADRRDVLRYMVRADPPALSVSVLDNALHSWVSDGEFMSRSAGRAWSQPWVPLWCDWELSLRVDDGLDRWTLGEVDLGVAGGEADGRASGRSRPDAGHLRLGAGARRADPRLAQRGEASRPRRSGPALPDHEQELADAANAAAGLDLLAGSFRGLRETLLGLTRSTRRW